MPDKPKRWRPQDIPTPAEMTAYLSLLGAVRDTLPVFPGEPELPPDMDGLTFSEANDIETVLLYGARAVTNLGKSRVYSGERMAGGF